MLVPVYVIYVVVSVSLVAWLARTRATTPPTRPAFDAPPDPAAGEWVPAG